MSEYSGSALVVTWIQAAATTVLTGDHQNCTLTPSIDYFEATAGPDANKSYVKGPIDHTATFEALLQSGTGSGGTLTYATLSTGNLGTLQIQPEGTASPKPKISLPAYSNGVAYAFPYNDVVKVTVNFQGNGALAESANS